MAMLAISGELDAMVLFLRLYPVGYLDEGIEHGAVVDHLEFGHVEADEQRKLAGFRVDERDEGAAV